uniref:Uncharacterized protein n=1 Tax=Picea sitchensis TaxID=3332 RepID=D5ABS9_PICSI|nr:unknown [Picea sitchensis]
MSWKNYRHRREPDGNSSLTIRTISLRKHNSTIWKMQRVIFSNALSASNEVFYPRH